MKKTLHWWEWLTMKPSELRECGHYSLERAQRTGHTRALSKRWARTVGYWGLEEPRDLMRRAGLDPAKEAHRALYDQFRYRWKVRTWRQTRRWLEQEPLPARVALAESAFAHVVEALNGQPPVMRKLPLHEAARWAAQHNGILPIEALLYYRALLVILDDHELGTLKTYLGTPNRHVLWQDASPWLPPEVYVEYARCNDEETEARLHGRAPATARSVGIFSGDGTTS
jgi:hypothetical protein